MPDASSSEIRIGSISLLSYLIFIWYTFSFSSFKKYILNWTLFLKTSCRLKQELHFNQISFLLHLPSFVSCPFYFNHQAPNYCSFIPSLFAFCFFMNRSAVSSLFDSKASFTLKSLNLYYSYQLNADHILDFHSLNMVQNICEHNL